MVKSATGHRHSAIQNAESDGTAVDTAVDDVLLRHGERVVADPVQHHPAGTTGKKGEYDGHPAFSPAWIWRSRIQFLHEVHAAAHQQR